MILSILILTVPSRTEKFLPKITNKLTAQAVDKPVEVLWLGDNYAMSIGEKRNRLLSIAKGDYVCFVDDDDDVSDDYVDLILAATRRSPDVIVFQSEYTEDGKNPRPVYFDMAFSRDVNHAASFDRIPNHLCPIKRDIALEIPYAKISMGEDSDYAQRLLRKVKSQTKINKRIYFHRFSYSTSESG